MEISLDDVLGGRSTLKNSNSIRPIVLFKMTTLFWLFEMQSQLRDIILSIVVRVDKIHFFPQRLGRDFLVGELLKVSP